MTLLKASSMFLAFLSTTGCVKTHLDFSGEAVCRSADGQSLCPKLSHFQSQLTLSPEDGSYYARLAYDPAQSRKASWYDSLDLGQQHLPPQRSWLADYELGLDVSERWSLHLEDSSGTTLLPNASGLAFATKFQDIGWKQTVTRLSFENPDIFVGDILVGLGEGERLSADDGALYYGARFQWYWQKAFGLQLGYSEDADSVANDAFWWRSDRGESHQDVSSQRLAISLILNGKLPSLRGLEASLGWQKNTLRSAREGTSERAPAPLAFDPTEILSEDFGAHGRTRRDAWLFTTSYRILAEYLIALHTGEFQAELEDAALTSCALEDTGNCAETAASAHRLRVREWTYGLGKIDSDGWSALLEAHEERYDRLYQNFHFVTRGTTRQKSMRLIQARMSWNW